MDALEEMRLADKKYGSTKQGIAPFYSDKYQKKTVLAGDLFYPEALKEQLLDLMEWKNLTLTKVYGTKPYTEAMLDEWLHTYCEQIKPFICDTGAYLKKAEEAGNRSCLKPSSARFVIWISVFIPIPLLLIPSRLMRRSDAAIPA